MEYNLPLSKPWGSTIFNVSLTFPQKLINCLSTCGYITVIGVIWISKLIIKHQQRYPGHSYCCYSTPTCPCALPSTWNAWWPSEGGESYSKSPTPMPIIGLTANARSERWCLVPWRSRRICCCSRGRYWNGRSCDCHGGVRIGTWDECFLVVINPISICGNGSILSLIQSTVSTALTAIENQFPLFCLCSRSFCHK